MAEARLRELRYPSAVIDDVRTLIEMHLRFHGYGEGWSDAAVRRYVRDAGPLLDRLNQLTRADVTTANLFKAKQFRALQDDLEERIARLAEEENLDAMRPALDGNEIMEHLGLPPGPLVGEARELPHGGPAGAGPDRARGGAARCSTSGRPRRVLPPGAPCPADRVDPGER